jgi:hypothetical protein
MDLTWRPIQARRSRQPTPPPAPVHSATHPVSAPRQQTTSLHSHPHGPPGSGVLLSSVSNPDYVLCAATRIHARHVGAGLYRAHHDGSLHVWDGSKLIPAGQAHRRAAFGVEREDERPSPDTAMVETDEELHERERSHTPSAAPAPFAFQSGASSPSPNPVTPLFMGSPRPPLSSPAQRGRWSSPSRSESETPLRSRSRSRSPDYRPSPRSRRSPSLAPVNRARAPWTSPGGTTRAQSPGGTRYRKWPPAGRYANKNRRYAAGLVNPPHRHSAMLRLWRAAANTPPPPGASQAAQIRHFMKPKRTFTVTSPGRSRTKRITGHKRAVLGHAPSASTYWNKSGHRVPRRYNLKHNRSADAYHGVEARDWSDASGASEPRYDSPRPDRGSDPSYWNEDHPDFQGGPWAAWRKDPPPGGAGSGTAV